VPNGDEGFATVGGAEGAPERFAAAMVLRINLRLSVGVGDDGSGGWQIARGDVSGGRDGSGLTRGSSVGDDGGRLQWLRERVSELHSLRYGCTLVVGGEAGVDGDGSGGGCALGQASDGLGEDEIEVGGIRGGFG
jgi:hypothetical protein